MEINKATEFLRSIKGFVVQYSYDKKDEKLDKVIELLEEGERYKAMWQTLLEDLDFIPNKEKLLMNWEGINNLTIKIEQKYFPKPIKKTIIIDEDLLFDIAKNIDKSFREYVKQHTVRALPISSDDLAIFSDSIMEGIKDIVNELKGSD